MVVLPPVGAIVNLAGFVIFLWLLTNFIAELHGFRSLLAVFGGIIFGMVLLAFGLAVVLLLLTGGAVA
jgi:Na+/H+-dicarboxylate symporter